jgi:hypothetical protein
MDIMIIGYQDKFNITIITNFHYLMKGGSIKKSVIFILITQFLKKNKTIVSILLKIVLIK